MSSVNIIVSHKGKKHDVEVDPESTGEVFKYQLFSLTGVEPDRQKILVKGGQLKDDTVMGKLGLKAGQTIMMMGTPGGGGGDLGRPAQPVKFVEDMTEAEAARQEGAMPAGLENLGNTCYLNSTLQVMRSIPELQESLSTYEYGASGPQDAGSHLDMTGQLRRLYKSMSETQSGFAPFNFLQALRTAFPQFAERTKDGRGYAQQDAEEAWSQIVAQLRQKLEMKKRREDEPATNLVDRYMAGEFTSVLECNEQEARDAGEQPVTSVEPFLKLNCHIQKDTNHLRDGIMNGLTETIEKRSPTLEREAVYTKKSKISRLPKYLTVHFVRFFWKREVQKKAKIMRKVTFPHELDVVEFCVDDLKKLLIPVRDKVREVRKDEEDMERARKRRKKNPLLDGDVDSLEQSSSKDSKKKDDKKGKGASASADGDIEMEGETFKTDAEVEAEREATLLEAKRELYQLISQNQGAQDGDNQSGLYELRGVVTHQGASADSGHYTAYVKKTAPLDPATGKPKESEDGNWWWFNDDKVSEVTADKIDGLAGGGESHSALILLYRAISLPSAEDVAEKKA
ncbi:ubiquitin carboxyl-terminal hydrolase 6 [Magnaporthiopsis poae ATCC 64411]|uniref:Ubiquitin carboxyl-terminal hydrolase n=1 Tax=Magnaporthiopsis poae (strain ATCC 64411 / 73-15) TaxID=644358 RepID=A0A0C4ECF8_MAGP6|nr:ubiquitin carboxyl-terminal hydrolase 6 [Magnaporthiopsis poae ATCC 64411]